MTTMIAQEERRRQVALFRRKADKVRSKGMAISVDGIMMRAVLAEVDALRAEVAACDPNDRTVVDAHEAEKAQLCADHAAEADALRAELARAVGERDAAKDVAAAAVNAAKNGEEPAKQRAPRTKEEPWRSICVAADEIIRDTDDRFSHLWGQSLVDALPEWGELTETDVKAWTRALGAALPVGSNGAH